MWLLHISTSPKTEARNSRRRLLKCGEEYPVGRKDDSRISISLSWISRDQGRFVVAPFTEKDVLGDKIPDLQYTSSKDWIITRGDVTYNVDKNVPRVLKKGDVFALHPKMHEVTVEWVEIVCCVPDAVTILEKECAPLGVKLCHGYDRRMTHLVTENITGEPNQLPVLLLGGAIVTPKWAKELFQRSNRPIVETASHDFQIPAPNDYLPSFSPDINAAYAEIGLWKSNPERRTLFKDRHFVFLIEGNSLSSLWKNIMDAGDAEHESFDVRHGPSKWLGTLTLLRTRAREQSFSIVLIADEASLNAATGTKWKDFIRETEQLGLRFIPFSKLTEAVLWCDVNVLKSEFNPGIVNSGPTDSIIPGTMSEASSLELSQDKSRTTRRRRATSAAPLEGQLTPVPEQTTKDEDVDTLVAPARSKLLKRRVRQPSAEPPSGSDHNFQPISPLLAESIPALDSSVQTLLGRSKLKRRNRTQSSQATEMHTTSLLDKHRQLFEETDPDRHFVSQNTNDLIPSITALSLAERVQLADEERLKALETATQTRKRKVEQIIEEEEEEQEEDELLPPESVMTGPQSRASSRSRSLGPPPKKRPNLRAESVELKPIVEVEETPATISPAKPRATAKSAKPTKVDKDTKYLTALASHRKGKRKEDEFDRDFNKLKISKPRTDELELDDSNAAMIAWQVGDIDMDTRGNFMVCRPLVPRDSTQVKRRKEGNPAWIGRPDFKKFKKKVTTKRESIKLVANLEHSDDEEEKIPSQDEDFQDLIPETNGRKKKPTRTQLQGDSGDESDVPIKPSTRGCGKTPATTRPTQTRKTPALFLADSEDERDIAAGRSVDESEDEAPKGMSNKTGTNKRPIVMAISSSDEDDRKKKKARRR